jgi:hypothetical protein
MAADQYRRRAFEARQRAAQASDSSIKAGWERVAHEWLALAEQVELFEGRYGKHVPAEPGVFCRPLDRPAFFGARRCAAPRAADLRTVSFLLIGRSLFSQKPGRATAAIFARPIGHGL